MIQYLVRAFSEQFGFSRREKKVISATPRVFLLKLTLANIWETDEIIPVSKNPTAKVDNDVIRLVCLSPPF